MDVLSEYIPHQLLGSEDLIENSLVLGITYFWENIRIHNPYTTGEYNQNKGNIATSIMGKKIMTEEGL